jgi:hypothetical protein
VAIRGDAPHESAQDSGKPQRGACRGAFRLAGECFLLRNQVRNDRSSGHFKDFLAWRDEMVYPKKGMTKL